MAKDHGQRAGTAKKLAARAHVATATSAVLEQLESRGNDLTITHADGVRTVVRVESLRWSALAPVFQNASQNGSERDVIRKLRPEGQREYLGE